MYKLRGHLVAPQQLLGPDWMTTKTIEVTLIEADERAKLARIVGNRLGEQGSGAVPIRGAGSGTQVIKLKVARLHNKLSADLIAALSAGELLGREVVVTFKIKRYTFRSNYASNNGETVSGVNFLLEQLESVV